jgi:hypothetical protein
MLGLGTYGNSMVIFKFWFWFSHKKIYMADIGNAEESRP